jgi:LPXTG-site transpeptidase (sortase) family protein
MLLVLLLSFRGYRYYEYKMNEQAREQLERAYYEAVLGDTETAPQGATDQINSEATAAARAIGRIIIPSLGIDYIILNQTTDKNLDISITKVVGPNLHEKGNLVLAGHNMKNGSLFGKLKKAKPSDIIVLEDLAGQKFEYKIVDQYKVNEHDLSPLSQQNRLDSIITLITCTEESDERLVVVGER